MKETIKKPFAVFSFCNMFLLVVFLSGAIADTAADIDRDADAALPKLYESAPAAKELSKVAKGILVFPNIIKGGMIIGGQYGEGAHRVGGKTSAYYSSVAASYGLQVGVHTFVVVADQGMASSLTTTTAKDDIYVFFFGQKGLMLGLGLQGTKISRITPDK
jgi:lipid-binding SYLF domain-containing protein